MRMAGIRDIHYLRTTAADFRRLSERHSVGGNPEVSRKLAAVAAGLEIAADEVDPGAPKPSLLIKTEHWRGQAEAARAKAELLDDVGSKRTMMDIGANYDSMADSAELLLAVANPNS
jgi:hypothetical protein